MSVALNSEQSLWLREAVGEYEVVADVGWPGSASSVSRVRVADRDLVVKTAVPPMRKHIAREIEAHQRWSLGLSAEGLAQELVAADPARGVVVLGWLDGDLVQGSTGEFDPALHEQAGLLVRRLHDQGSGRDTDLQARLVQRTREWLQMPNNVPEAHVVAALHFLDEVRPQPVVVVPTHGDWHPRNWIAASSGRAVVVKAIDFGRFGWRTPQSDLLRLSLQQWRGRPELERAFLDGYGCDPRDGPWQLELLAQAVANACWAHSIGDTAFERQGLDEIRYVLGLDQ